MATGLAASAARRAANRLAAASHKSPVGLRLKTSAPAPPVQRQEGLAGVGRGDVQAQRRLRRIVPREAARRAARIGLRRGERTDDGFDLRPRHRAGAEQSRRPIEQGDDGRLKADGARAAVEGERRPPPVSTRASATIVGLGRPDRFADGATTGRPKRCSTARASGCAGARTATVSRPARARSQMAAGSESGATMVSAPGPERLRELDRARVEAGEAPRGGQVLDMGDQGIEARTPLGLEQARDGDRIGGVGGETIDRLGGQDDELARQSARAAASTSLRAPDAPSAGR